MTLPLVQTWVKQLETICLPEVAGIQLPRDLGLEHQLALEFDGPRQLAQAQPSTHPALGMAQGEGLLQEVTLNVEPIGCMLVLKCPEQHQSFELTRKESHAVLDMLAGKARAAGWLEQPDWPGWLGS